MIFKELQELHLTPKINGCAKFAWKSSAPFAIILKQLNCYPRLDQNDLD